MTLLSSTRRPTSAATSRRLLKTCVCLRRPRQGSRPDDIHGQRHQHQERPRKNGKDPRVPPQVENDEIRLSMTNNFAGRISPVTSRAGSAESPLRRSINFRAIFARSSCLHPGVMADGRVTACDCLDNNGSIDRQRRDAAKVRQGGGRGSAERSQRRHLHAWRCPVFLRQGNRRLRPAAAHGRCPTSRMLFLMKMVIFGRYSSNGGEAIFL
jgi:hypothetical protein